MPHAFLALAHLLVAAAAATPHGRVYNARQQQHAVQAPRATGDAVIDGRLDEPQWRAAAVLTGFSLYQPVDGVPAPDSTEVLVWYTASALYVGVRAFEPHGDPASTVRATLADRDRISSDDNVQLLLDTFDDKRRAFVFSVNPLGVQADGMRSENGGTDLSPDFLFESKGRVTAQGYEVELRIPFSSLRYPPGHAQRWGLNVVRVVQHSGYQETWMPVQRASSSFLSQSGVLEGLTGLARGRVMRTNPEVTARATGEPTLADDWRYRVARDVGANVKLDLSSSLTLNGTVHPDFSQVEADAAQIATDPRFALFYSEKRPFFIDGLEQFDVPNRLVYTRRIVQPLGATKLTGTVGGTDVALLAAADDRMASASGTDRPAFLVTRLRRPIGTDGTTLGLVFTDREDGPDANRVLGADARVLFGGLYFAQVQLAASQTRQGSTSRVGPLWEAMVDRTGRSYGFHYQITGIDSDFVAGSGFVNRTGYVRPSMANRWTAYGTPGALIESYTARLEMSGLWAYDDFFGARSVLEDQATLNNSVTFRGGWSMNLSPSVATDAFDPAAYRDYAVAQASDTTPFVVPGRLASAGVRASVSTPQFRRFAASASYNHTGDVDFIEADAVQRRDASVGVDWRPTQQLRTSFSWQSSTLRRRRDGSVLATARIPRVKAEYQVSRPAFVRLVAQYDARMRAALLDPGTGAPIVTGGPGSWQPSPERRSNAIRLDGLFSYQPSPGTVVFAGYGSSLTEPDPLAFDRLRRTADAFFMKVSYLFQS